MESPLEQDVRATVSRRDLVRRNYSVAFEARLTLAQRKALRGDPLEYVRLQWPNVVLDWFQEDILLSMFDDTITEVFIKGCTGPGKGFAVALGVNVWFDCYPESRIILTSSTYQQAFSVIFGEVVTQRRKMRRPMKASILKESIEEAPKHYIRIVNPEFGVGESFSGQHGPNTLFVLDEASAVSDFIYENATKQSRMIVALSNPRIMSGWFRRGFSQAVDEDQTQTIQTPHGGRRLVTVGATHCLNVKEKRLHRPVAPYGGLTINGTEYKSGERITPEDFAFVRAKVPGQLDYSRYIEIMSHSSKRHRDIFGEARFPEDDVTQVIQGCWLERHENAWLENEANDSHPVPEAFGLDVALSETNDQTVLASGNQFGMTMLHTTQRADAMSTAGWVFSTVKNRYGIDLQAGAHPVAVDYSGGHGQGVGDRMKEAGCWVIPVRGNATPDDTGHYRNKRAEMYGELGRRLDPAGPWANSPWPLMPDAMLREELVAPEKLFLGDGIKFQISPKSPVPNSPTESIKDKIGRSPDRADAVVYLYEAVRTMSQAKSATLDRPLLVGEPEPKESLPKDPIDELLAALLEQDDQEDTIWDYKQRQQEAAQCLVGF